MAGLVPAIHAAPPRVADRDARNKSGHDGEGGGPKSSHGIREFMRTSEAGHYELFIFDVAPRNAQYDLVTANRVGPGDAVVPPTNLPAPSSPLAASPRSVRSHAWKLARRRLSWALWLCLACSRAPMPACRGIRTSGLRVANSSASSAWYSSLRPIHAPRAVRNQVGSFVVPACAGPLALYPSTFSFARWRKAVADAMVFSGHSTRSAWPISS